MNFSVLNKSDKMFWKSCDFYTRAQLSLVAIRKKRENGAVVVSERDIFIVSGAISR